MNLKRIVLGAVTLAAAATEVAGQSLAVTNPGNATYLAGSTLQITWQATGGDPTAKLDITLENRDAFLMPFGQRVITIAQAKSTGDGSFSYDIPTTLNTAPNYRIRVWGSLRGFEAFSPWFSVRNNADPVKVFTVQAPLKNAALELCSTYTARWVVPLVADLPAGVFARVYDVNTKRMVYELPETVTPRDGSYSFLVPDTLAIAKDRYILTFWKSINPPNLTPGYSEAHGANSEVFSVVEAASKNNTCPPPPKKPGRPGDRPGVKPGDFDNAAGDFVPGLGIALVLGAILLRLFF